MKLAWITDSFIAKGYRELKTKITAKLIESSKASFPFGFEANPTKNYIAIVGNTMSRDEPVIIGYLNPRALEDLEVGDSMIYSTDADGVRSATLKMRADGTIELLGDSDNAVRYSPLDSNLQNLVSQLQQELVKIQAGITSAGGAYTPGTLTLDISDSRIEQIKVS